MRCAGCGQDNREGRKFCAACGVPLALACPACGAANEPGEKFCGECGAELQGARGLGGYGVKGSISEPLTPNPVTPDPIASTGSRKVVTIVFADLVGSTALHERLDAEAVRQFMERYYAAMRGAVEAHGGRVTQLMGDGVKAVFGAPRVAEDDAIRAVCAAVEMQRAFHILADEQRERVGKTGLRVAVNTGEVVAEEGREIIGDPVNVAARLQEQGKDGDVVIGGSTQRLVASLVTLDRLGTFTLKGRSEAVEVYRVVSLEPPAGVTTAAFVGRDQELARLTAVYETAVAKPAARLAVLLGSPGLGKSRLITELAQRLGGAATILTAHCDAAGGASFAPLVAPLRQHCGIDEGNGGETLRAAIEAALPGDDAERGRIVGGIAALLAGSPASPEETFFVVRRLLSAFATVKPVVLVIDDLHWAEPLLFDLVEHLVQWGSGVPLLVLVGARPELREARSSLATPGGFVTDLITLAGLDAGAATRLAANVIGAADLPTAVAAKVLATSEGNPLFVGELVRMLVQEGALTKEGDRWTIGAGLAALEMPPTIHALLAARIERLRPEERAVLERAAVVGRHFSRSAVAALLPHDAADLDARLESLRRSELIERDTGWLLGEPALRFHHVLIRDAAYRRLLKGTRAELHARLADWMEAQVADAAEHDETIGWHLEQAHQHLCELGPVDAAGAVLGERAARRLAAAGRRALARDDVALAASLLGRAIDRLDAADPSRAELARDWCEALLAAGDVATAAKAIDELGRWSEGARCEVRGARDEQGARDEVRGAREEFGPPFDSSLVPHPSSLDSDSHLTPHTSHLRPDSHLAPNTSQLVRLRAWHTCFASQLTVLTAPQGLQAAADAVAEAARQLAAQGDAAGEAKAHSVHAQALARLGKVGAAEVALDQALAAARKAGDRRRANAVLAGAPLAALWGPSPVTRASGRCLDVVRVLRITQGAPAVESVALSCQGVLEALRGRTEAARRMLASARRMVEELGIAHRLFEVDAFAGRIAMLEGDTAAAERLLRGAYEGLRDLGLGIDAARAGTLLARTLLAQGRVAEAEALSHESEQLAGDDLQAAIAWRGVRAEALAKRGEHAAAVELAKAAVAIASSTDALLDHADARVALATALRAAGRGGEADAEERRAIELWEVKGGTLLVERARRKVLEPFGAEGLPASDEADHEADAPARFEHDREVEALARFDALTANADPKRPARRRVRPNAATSMQARFDAALAARDFDAIAAVFHDDHQEIDHPTGSTYGREAAIASLRRLFRSRDPHYQAEPLATLGELLLLVRRRSGAAGTASGRYDVGAYENEAIQLFAVDASGLCRCAEVFAPNHLGDAIVRLYERYAELLPEGPVRTHAAGVARSVAAWNGPVDPDHLATVYASSSRIVDHRFLGTWSARNAGEILGHFRLQLDLAPDFAARYEDVFAVAADALVASMTFFGTARDSGGAFENRISVLFTFGADGLVTESAVFEAEHVAEALARFDALVASTKPTRPARRRLRANAATRGIERFQSVIAARDGAALAEVFAESLPTVHHATRATYGRREMLSTWRSIMKADRMEFRSEILASLGGTLALERHFLSMEGLKEAHVAEFGRSEFEEIVVIEADDRGRWLHCEIFAADRLGDAIACLYARHAECLQDGPARGRAASTARAVAAMLTRSTEDRLEDVMVPDLQVVDHRTVGLGPARGPDLVSRWRAASDELAQDETFRIDDVLALSADALLRRTTQSGTVRASGGAFETSSLALSVFGPDGRQARFELFDVGREGDALARFDALAGGVEWERGEPFANTASRSMERLTRCWAARDWASVLALLSPALRMDDRRRLMRLEIGFADFVTQLRMLFDQPGSRWHEPLLATRGDRLALHRTTFQAEVEGGGPLAFDDHLTLVEADADGRCIGVVAFDLDDIDAAFAELDARYYAGEGAAHPVQGAIMRAFTRAVVSRDWDPVLALCAPQFIEHDHRSLAVLGTTRGAAAWVENFRTLVDLAPDTVYRVDHLRSAAGGFCSAGNWVGSRDGGRYEIPLIAILELDDRDRLARADIYDPDQLDHALARFDEVAAAATTAVHWENSASRAWREVIAAWRQRDLERFAFENPMLLVEQADEQGRSERIDTYDIDDLDLALARFTELQAPATAREPFANAATASANPVIQCLIAHDWEGFRQLFAEDFHMSDRRRVVQLELDRDQYVAFTREVADGRTIRNRWELVATRGDRLAVTRSFYEFTDADIGPSEIAFLILMEVDERGRIVANVRWDLDDLDAAYAELDARWARGEAAVHPAASKWLADYLRHFAARDWNSMSALLAPDVIGENHRLVGWGTRHGPEGIVSTLQAQVELAPDTRERVDHARTCQGALLFEYAWYGTREGGAFENVWIVLIELDAAGRGRRADVWEPEQLDRAQARFAEISGRVLGDTLPPLMKPTTATAAVQRAWATFDTGDFDAARALCAPSFEWEDLRPLVGLSGDVELMIASARERLATGARHQRREIIGTAGDRIVIGRVLWAGGPAGGRFEVEFLVVNEVDADGLCTAMIFLDPEDLRGAQREAWAHWAAIDPAPGVVTAVYGAVLDAANDRDLPRYRALFADELVVEDHRHGMRIEGLDAYAEQVALLWQHAPDSRIDGGWFWPAFARHGAVTVTRRSGAIADEFLWLFIVEQGRIARIEVFSLDDLEAANARFEELGAASTGD